MRIRLYVALGDSMSIDLYPACDLHKVGWPVGSPDPVGAASLLFRNRDDLWPEFRGRDLERLSPGVERVNLTADGAMIGDVAIGELARAGQDLRAPGLLVTLTAGGNDLLAALATGTPLGPAVDRIMRRYGDLVAEIRGVMPGALLILTTVYDPTDGTGRLPGLDSLGRLPIEYLERFNDRVRSIAQATPGAALADVHRRFLGHGVSAPEEERWYWPHSMIEPGARGASEIRRAWLDALLQED